MDCIKERVVLLVVVVVVIWDLVPIWQREPMDWVEGVLLVEYVLYGLG
jgi:hypothetical protein